MASGTEHNQEHIAAHSKAQKHWRFALRKCQAFDVKPLASTVQNLLRDFLSIQTNGSRLLDADPGASFLNID